MKIYSVTLDWREPLRQKLWVPPHSDFGIAVKIMKDGAVIDPLEYWGVVYKGSRDTDPLTPETEPIGQWGVYLQKSGETGETVYLVDVMQEGEPGEEGDPTDPVRVKTFYITVVTTDSTVFDVGKGGGGGGLSPESTFPQSGVTITDEGIISVDKSIIPWYDGTVLNLGADTQVDTAELATQNYVDQMTETKAEQTSVDELQNQLGEKADWTALNSKADVSELAAKADVTAVDELNSIVETKAGYEDGAEGQTLKLGETAYDTTVFSGEYEDGGTFTLKVLANQ